MSYSSLPFATKLFQLTSLTCALALAGCGGGDTVDVITPAPGGGGTGGNGTGGNNSGGTGSGQTPTVEADFFLQSIAVEPQSIELSDKPTTFSVTIKAAEKSSGGAVANKDISLKVEDSENVGVTINGQSTIATDSDGNVTYKLQLTPQAVKDKAALLLNGFTLTATAKKKTGAVVTQTLKVPVFKKGSGDGTQVEVSTLNVEPILKTSSVSTNILNAYGDNATLSVIVKNENGARESGVNVSLGINSIKGIAITGGNSKETDANGIAAFNIEVDANLNKAERDALIQNGLVYAINIKEKNGASKQITDKLDIAPPQSDYRLVVDNSANKINAYGETRQLRITAKAINSNVATKINGAKVSVQLNTAVEGVTLSQDSVVLDSAGQATVDLSVAKNISEAARKQLAAEGISYTLVLSEPNRSMTSQTYVSPVYIPVAQYQISFANNDKAKISSYGSTAIVSFRVNDKNNGGVIANQKVTAVLPKALRDARLLTLDGSAEQVTDAKGMVSYTVRVPNGLDATQRSVLEKEGGFNLFASMIEASGAPSSTTSERILVTAESETQLSSSTSPSIINVLKDQFQIQVTGKRSNGSAAAGKQVKLTIDNLPGISIVGNEQTTNASGVATFTVNIDPSLTRTQREALVTSGIPYTAILTDDDGIATQKHTATAVIPVAEYKLNFGTASKIQLSSSGGSTQLSFRVNDKNGGVIAGQPVTAVLPKALTDAGLLTLESAATQLTDAAGMVSYTVRVPAGLTNIQKAELETIGGFVLTTAIIENSGAATTAESGRVRISNELAKSETQLSSSTSPSIINVLKDQFQIQVTGKRSNGSAAAGKQVKLTIDNLPGISIVGNEQTTNASGVATFTVNIDPSLTRTQREALVTSGIPYTAILTDDDGIATQKHTATAVIPVAEYKLNFGTASKIQLSSSGGSTQLSFRVNDKNGGVIAGQPVTAVLPKALTDAGLLTLESAATQLTDAAGMVSYTVRVPAGLEASKKSALESAASFTLSANMVESSGASSELSSSPIRISAGIGQSDTILTATSIPKVVNLTDNQFKIQISAKRSDSSTVVGNTVKLLVKAVEGITVQGNEQTTDAAGNATFLININPNLTEVQRNALVASGIEYSAILTEEDGTQAKIDNQSITVTQPATTIDFASITAQGINEFGGSGRINVRLVSKSEANKPVEAQEVTLQLSKKVMDYGVRVDQSSAITDFNGETTFQVIIPEGLTAAQRAELKAVGITYQLTYVENKLSYKSAIQNLAITTPAVDLSILNAPNLINNRPFYTLNGEGDAATIQAVLSTQNTNLKIAGQPIELVFADKELAGLLNVNGKLGSAINIVNTAADGTAAFNILVPNNLTATQKAALEDKKLTATLTETLTGKTQEIQFNIQSTKAAIGLIAIPPKNLDLNGGETQIEAIAQDSKGNVIAGQTVFLALPAAIASQGVILTTSNKQITDDSGKVTYTVAVPAGLTAEQKAAIGSSFSVVFTAADSNGNIATKISSVTTTDNQPSNGTQENLSIVANKVVSSKGDTFKVFVRLANNRGSIADRNVRLNVDDPIKTGVTIANNNVKTNGDGVATFELKLEPGANVDQTVLETGIGITETTITPDNFELIQKTNVAVDIATIDSYQIITSSDKSTLNTGGDQTSATFRVTDGKGGILTGVPVQLSIANLEASGAALTTPSMVTTDANGQIDVGVLLAANSINARLNHNININAKIVTPTYDANGNVSLTTREQQTLSLSATGTQIALKASTTQLREGESTTVTSTLIDGAGRAIAGAGMELVTAEGIAVATNGITNADGIASFTVSENDANFDSNGNLRIFARATGENRINAQRSLTSIDLVKVSQAGISFIDIKDVYDVNTPQTINIQIRTDSPDQALTLLGKSVEVQTTIGKFADGKVITIQPITAANVRGNIVTVPVQLTSQLAGTTVLQATVLGEMVNGVPKYQTTVDTRFRATTPAKMLFQAVKSVITPGSSTELVATVKDKNDVPVEGQTVVFSRTADSSAGRLSAATAVTDARGEARVVYLANASSPIGGVVINANLLQDPSGIGTKTTTITVSKEAVYTTLAFSNKLSSDNIYYTVQGSISVMDGSGRAVANKEVSIKSYATEYAQGKICLLNSTVSYQKKDEIELDENGKVVKITTPEPKAKSEIVPIFLQSNWKMTEDGNYNYTLDKEPGFTLTKPEDVNGNGTLEAINPVAIIGGTVSGDGYTFITDSEGRADFSIRYPMRYSNWVKVRFDATTFLNGSENLQSINYQLPTDEADISIVNSTLATPWIDNTSPFGDGGAMCTNSMSVTINENSSKTRVALSPYSPNYSVSIDGEMSANASTTGFNSYIIDFNKAYELGSTVSVSNNGFGFSKVLKID